MKKTLFSSVLLTFITTTLMAYSDADLDGVDDSVDKCPGTPLTELVDINGCPKKSLVSPHHFDVVVGFAYADSQADETTTKNTTLSQSLQLDYFYKNFSLQLATSYYENNTDNESGMYDTFIGMAYQLKPLESLSMRFGVGVLLPTYDSSLNNNNTDYTASFNLSYKLSKSVNIFGSYTYTMINDDDYSDTTVSYRYQDSDAYSGGFGYYLSSKLYLSTAYSSSKNILIGEDDIENALLYLYVALKDGFFTTLSYSYGLSDAATDNRISLRVGYYF